MSDFWAPSQHCSSCSCRLASAMPTNITELSDVSDDESQMPVLPRLCESHWVMAGTTASLVLRWGSSGHPVTRSLLHPSPPSGRHQPTRPTSPALPCPPTTPCPAHLNISGTDWGLFFSNGCSPFTFHFHQARRPGNTGIRGGSFSSPEDLGCGLCNV